MALKKRTYVNNETVISAENLNDIQDSIVDVENSLGEINTALDELHAYAQGLISGGATE